MQNNYNNDDNTFTSGYRYVDNPQDNVYPDGPDTVPVLTDSSEHDMNSEAPQTLMQEQYAGFGVRLLAYFIDNTILLIALLIVRAVLFVATHIMGLDFLSNEILFRYSLSDIFHYVIRAAYFVLMTYYTGATLGKHLLKIHVISANQNEKYSFFDILYRETIGRFLSKTVLYIGYFISIANQDKATLHDMLSDTRVTYKKNNSQ